MVNREIEFSSIDRLSVDHIQTIQGEVFKMSAELFYLVGKPNHIKQEFVSQLKEKLVNEVSIIVPDVYTTDKEVAEGENYIHLDERDFVLRQSMGMYCLNWEKKQQQYGVVADLIQRLNTGVDVILNGSLHNLEQATKQFPNINTVLIRKPGCRSSESVNQYLIAEDEEVRLEWSDSDQMGHPYVLTLMSEESIDKAVEMLIGLVTYERKSFDKVV